jgi:hypothetical protein
LRPCILFFLNERGETIGANGGSGLCGFFRDAGISGRVHIRKIHTGNFRIIISTKPGVLEKGRGSHDRVHPYRYILFSLA